jgi:hypothetical protein
MNKLQHILFVITIITAAIGIILTYTYIIQLHHRINSVLTELLFVIVNSIYLIGVITLLIMLLYNKYCK